MRSGNPVLPTLTLLSLLALAACTPNPSRVNTLGESWYSSDGSHETAAVGADTVAFVDVIRGHYAMPEEEQDVIRREAEKDFDEWRSFLGEVRDRHDYHYRTWYHDNSTRWAQRHQGVGVGNSLALLGRAVEIDPSFVEAWTDMGVLASRVGDWPTALQHFERALLVADVRRDFDRPVDRDLLLKIHRERAWALRDLARWDEGLAAVAEGMAVAPADQDLTLIKGLLLAGAGRHTEAVQVAVAMPPYRFPHYNFIFYGLKKKPSSYANRWIRSQALLAQGDYDGAMWAFRDMEAYVHMGLLIHAERFWRDVGLAAELSGHPKAGLYYALGHIAREYWGFYPLTAESLGPVALETPDPQVPVFTSFGRRFYAGGSPLSYIALQMNRMAGSDFPPRRMDAAGRALQMIDIAERRNLRPDVCRALRGRIYYYNDDFDRARDELLAARTAFYERGRIDPGTSLLLGLLELQGGRHQGAARYLEEAAREDPRLAAAWRSLGVVYAQLGLPDRALSAMDTAVRIEPRSVPGLYNRGLFLLQHGDKTGARADLKVALALDPENREVRRMLELAGGREAAGAGELPEEVVAEDLLRDPEALMARLNEDIDLMFAGVDSFAIARDDLEQAIVDLQRQYVERPTSATRKILALAYIDTRRLREAQDLLAPGWGVDLEPDEEVMLLYVDHLLGESARARALADALVRGEDSDMNPYALAKAAEIITDDPRAGDGPVDLAFWKRMDYGHAKATYTDAIMYAYIMRVGFANARGSVTDSGAGYSLPMDITADPFFRALSPAGEGRSAPNAGIPTAGTGK